MLNRGGMVTGPATSVACMDEEETRILLQDARRITTFQDACEVFNLRFYNRSSRLTLDCCVKNQTMDRGAGPLFMPFFPPLSTRPSSIAYDPAFLAQPRSNSTFLHLLIVHSDSWRGALSCVCMMRLVSACARYALRWGCVLCA